MVLSERGLVDLKRAPHQRFGLFKSVRRVQQSRQVVEAICNSWVLGAVGGLADFQRMAHQGLCLSEATCALQQLRQFVRRRCDQLRIGEFLCLRKRMALLLLALFPPCEIHQHRRNSQALRNPFLGIAHVLQRISQEGQPSLGERAQRQSISQLREPMGKTLEVAASMHLPSRNHVLDLGEKVRSRRSAGNDAGDRPAHCISSQGRGFEHVVRHLLCYTAAGEDSGHVELCGRSLHFVTDFAQVVERPFHVDAAPVPKLRTQLAALFLSCFVTRIEEAEEIEQEWHAPASSAGEIHCEPDVEESLADRVEAGTLVSRVPGDAQVVGIGETLEKRRGFLLAHAHS